MSRRILALLLAVLLPCMLLAPSRAEDDMYIPRTGTEENQTVLASYTLPGETTPGHTFIVHNVRYDGSALVASVTIQPVDGRFAAYTYPICDDPSAVYFEVPDGYEPLGAYCELTLEDASGKTIFYLYATSERRGGAYLETYVFPSLPEGDGAPTTLVLTFGVMETPGQVLHMQVERVALPAPTPGALNEPPVLTADGQPAPAAYIEEVARLSRAHGAYDAWPLTAKQALAQAMQLGGLLGQAEAPDTEQAIDDLVLARYGTPSQPGDLGVASVSRIAQVELGDPTQWNNDTWVWYSRLMMDTGLWNTRSDVDVYETPGPEAIPPEEAVRLAQEWLVSQGTLTQAQAAQAKPLWHYVTHDSDTLRAQLTYCVHLTGIDGASATVFLTPDGTPKE